MNSVKNFKIYPLSLKVCYLHLIFRYEYVTYNDPIGSFLNELALLNRKLRLVFFVFTVNPHV